MPASRLAQASDHSFFDITPTGYVRSAGTSPSLALGIRGGPLCLDTIRHRVGATPTARQRNPDRASAQPRPRVSATLRSDEFARWSHFVALQGLRTQAQIPRLSAECDSLNSEL
ncbi:hypothetical protein GOALK_060_01260 [Gordonia alkanivorans NBRC 16433]|uniref:Uncharacterized protein n=1 Tax=Gordonia alkanivorans NBRC 16433 TaxID=1027371 RepID=F9VWA4_9ACTN|nr:hypothetical protein GOALK_060_01260 [Gordonia alkanivorans NBRC 16433]